MKINSSYISLENCHFYAYHGVALQETKIGNDFLINLRLKTNISRAIETDDVEDTISYAEIHQVIKDEMAIPSLLLEHVCGRIAQRLFGEFPAIEEIEIKLSKRNPPMGADIDSAAIEMFCSR